MTSNKLIGGLLGCSALLIPSRSYAETVLPKQGYATAYTINEFAKTDGRCAQLPKTPCTQIKVSYPSFQSSSKHLAAIDAINAEVKRFLLQSATDEQSPASIDAAMSRFIQSYQQSVQGVSQRWVWSTEKQVIVLRNQPNLLSLQYSHYWYTGGAHPNSSRTYWNFDPQTGNQIQLSDLFIEGYAPKLNAIAETHFRRAKKLDADASLNQAGFWFENDKFQVNTNFAIAPKGLIFFFNSYEIGPYVIGPTELKIPYTELKRLIKHQALLSNP